MADIDFRYPFSTAEGTPIPLDVIRPVGILSLDFNNVTGTAAISIPDTIEVVTAFSDADCLIQFATSSASATALVNGVLKADAMYVSADVFTIISPPNGKRSISILGIAGSGTMILQYVNKWTALALQPQFARR